MVSNNPNIEEFHYVICPAGFENLLFSQHSSSYLMIDRAVGSYSPPFVLQNPAESVANCISLNSQNWHAAKKNMPASLNWQATRGLAVYHLQGGKPLIAIYPGRDPS